MKLVTWYRVEFYFKNTGDLVLSTVPRKVVDDIETQFKDEKSYVLVIQQNPCLRHLLYKNDIVRVVIEEVNEEHITENVRRYVESKPDDIYTCDGCDNIHAVLEKDN